MSGFTLSQAAGSGDPAAHRGAEDDSGDVAQTGESLDGEGNLRDVVASDSQVEREQAEARAQEKAERRAERAAKRQRLPAAEKENAHPPPEKSPPARRDDGERERQALPLRETGAGASPAGAGAAGGGRSGAGAQEAPNRTSPPRGQPTSPARSGAGNGAGGAQQEVQQPSRRPSPVASNREDRRSPSRSLSRGSRGAPSASGARDAAGAGLDLTPYALSKICSGKEVLRCTHVFGILGNGTVRRCSRLADDGPLGAGFPIVSRCDFCQTVRCHSHSAGEVQHVPTHSHRIVLWKGPWQREEVAYVCFNAACIKAGEVMKLRVGSACRSSENWYTKNGANSGNPFNRLDGVVVKVSGPVQTQVPAVASTPFPLFQFTETLAPVKLTLAQRQPVFQNDATGTQQLAHAIAHQRVDLQDKMKAVARSAEDLAFIMGASLKIQSELGAPLPCQVRMDFWSHAGLCVSEPPALIRRRSDCRCRCCHRAVEGPARAARGG